MYACFLELTVAFVENYIIIIHTTKLKNVNHWKMYTKKNAVLVVLKIIIVVAEVEKRRDIFNNI